MNEKELKKALLGLDAAGITSVPNAHEITRKVLERDRSVVRTLTWVTIFLWVVAAVGATLVIAAQLVVHPAMLQTIPNDGTPLERDRYEHARLGMVDHVTAAVAVSIGLLALAALGTIRLVLASHKATIRQVNATLVEISAQLKEMRQSGS